MMLKQIGLLAGIGLFLLGCAGEQPLQSHQAIEPHESTAVSEVVAAYDAVRSRLANEETDTLVATFDRLGSAALEASSRNGISELARSHLRMLADAARKGVEAGDADLDGAREAFGEVSKNLVAAVASDQDLAHGLYIFECPMTGGYPKWVQTSDAKANPYMGKDMQSCGVESQWAE